MTESATLHVLVGQSSLKGARARNEDCCAAVTPSGPELEHKGVLAAMADGVGGHARGGEAAEHAIRGLIADYYATPDTWSIAHSLDTVLGALNRWLHAQGAHAHERAGMATTLSALVLRGRRYVTAHVGDSRIYRWRAGRLERLTNDHVWPHPELDSVLSRALGLDLHLAVDLADGDLEPGDSFVLLTDGVWATLGDARIAAMLADNAARDDAEALARKLTMAAIDAGSGDNCSALVVHVADLPPDRLPDAVARFQARPAPPVLRVGDALDGLEVVETLHESRATLLYRVQTPQGQDCVLKTLRPHMAHPEFAAALAHEEWLASRVHDKRFPQVVPHAASTHLYYLMSWHAGASLAAHLRTGRHFSIPEVEQLGCEIVKGLATLHRLAILHRDIKPDNLHLGADGQLRILDLGVAASDGDPARGGFGEINNPGTPSYMAPERFAGEPASVQTDLYAVGVTLYELLTRRYPYGEIEPFQNPRFRDPVPPTRYRADIPEWLESVLLKAVARNPRERFETAEELLLALELGADRPLQVARRSPLLRRDPELGPRLLLVASLVLNVFLLYLLLAR